DRRPRHPGAPAVPRRRRQDAAARPVRRPPRDRRSARRRARPVPRVTRRDRPLRGRPVRSPRRACPMSTPFDAPAHDTPFQAPPLRTPLQDPHVIVTAVLLLVYGVPTGLLALLFPVVGFVGGLLDP